MAARRCGKVFMKTPDKQATQTKKSSRTRQAKIEAKETKEQEDEPLSDRERQELMVQWAVNGFKPSGPKGFAPTEGTVQVRIKQTETWIMQGSLDTYTHFSDSSESVYFSLLFIAISFLCVVLSNETNLISKSHKAGFKLSAVTSNKPQTHFFKRRPA